MRNVGYLVTSNQTYLIFIEIFYFYRNTLMPSSGCAVAVRLQLAWELVCVRHRMATYGGA